MKVFLSYCAGDRVVAERLAEHLTGAGYQVWDPNDALYPGDNWALRIGQALEDSEAMVVLISPEAMKSEWVRHELEYALGSIRYKGRLIPVVLKPTKDIPWIVKRLPMVHLKRSLAEVSKEVAGYLKHGFELVPSDS